MAAHVFIVTPETFPIVRDRGIAAIIGEDVTKKLSEKTKADLCSDMCCVRRDDKIFFYEQTVGFHGIYKAISEPFIDEEEFNGIDAFSDEFICGSKENPHYVEGQLIYPTRIQIRPYMYLKNPISEMKAFGELLASIKLRSLFYRKTLQRGKSITHLSPEEENELIELLLKANDGMQELKSFQPYLPIRKEPIKFDLEPDENSCVKYEKILEGWLIQHIDDESVGTEKFLGPLDDIEWFANYVPVTVAGGNIDVLVYHTRKVNNKNIRYKISIIELKKDSIKNIPSQADVIQLEEYVKWASKNLTNNNLDVIQPIFIGKEIHPSAIERAKNYSLSLRKPIFVTYTIDNNTIKFEITNY